MKSDKEIEERAQRYVCKFCGGSLVAKFVVFNKYGGQGKECYCEQCQRIEYGVEPEVYALAEYFVDNFEFNYYLDMEENTTSFQLNVAKINEILSWAFKERTKLRKLQ